MREIKFRAWDIENEYMITSKQGVYTALRNIMDITRQDDGYYNNGELLKPNKNKYELMQFTGLYDKNKTPIYESDIVEFSYDYFNGNWDAKVLRGTVDFEYGCYYVNVFIIEDEKVSEEYPQCFLLDEVTQDIEVIGNKFDNPDLLGE